MMKIILLGTSGCHLCEEAEEVVSSAWNKKLINIENVDIAEQIQWQEEYAVRIPVLFHPETKKELSWPFNQTQVQTFIKELMYD